MTSNSGVILDTTILIAAERGRKTIRQLLDQARASVDDRMVIAISTVSIVELTHGLHRAATDAERERRRIFADDLIRSITVVPLTLEIARLAGKIEAEQAEVGIGIPFEDLLIGATALHLGYATATRNIKHFQLIPGLPLITI